VLEHAVAFLDVKAAPDGARSLKFSGVATTPTPDRQGDVLDPFGATWTNPLPLLFHHDRQQPIGLVTLRPATADGIAFDAEIPFVDEPGPLRERTRDARQSLAHGLIRAVSVAYRVLSGGIAPRQAGGALISRYEICELSLVSVPMNMHATIQSVKSLDASYLAAPGRIRSGVPDPTTVPPRTKGAPPMTAQEKVTQFENSRAAKVAAMVQIMDGVTDATLDPETREKYDDLALEVKGLDEHLERARDLARIQAAGATRVDGTPTLRTPTPVVSVKSTVEPGLTYARSIKALLNAKGDSYRAMEYAKVYRDPNVDLLIKAAVTPGTTTDPTWAGALVTVSNLTNEFIELARAATILGKIPGLFKVPFNCSVPIVTGGGTYKWVGQGKAKPVGKMTFGSTSLGMAKAAGIIVLTEELVRSSSPSAELIVRNEMVKGIAAFLDQQFTDPAVAAAADQNPASITNGAQTAASTNNPGEDIGKIITFFSTNGIPLTNLAVIMSEANAFAMGYTRNALGQPHFPGVTAAGGSANGVQIIASNTVGTNVIAVAPEYVLYADDGQVVIDVSREASLQMNDAPATPADPATTVWTNLWQENLVGLRAERFINWKRAVPNAVYYLTAAQYPFAPVVVTP